MANETSFYLVAQGAYVSTEAWLAAESWQTGIRLCVQAGTSFDDLGTFPDNIAIQPTTVNRDETDWTITSNWLANVPFPPTNNWSPDDYLNDVAGPAYAAWMAATDCFASYPRLTDLALYPIGPTGKVIPAPPYAAGSPCRLTWKTPVPGYGTGMTPPQLTTAASYRTAQTGRRGRGRGFLPPLAPNAIVQGKLSAAAQPVILANQVTLLEALGVTTGVPGSQVTIRPCVTGKPFVNYAVVNSIRLGNVIDTQRRRRRSAIETYASTSLTY